MSEKFEERIATLDAKLKVKDALIEEIQKSKSASNEALYRQKKSKKAAKSRSLSLNESNLA